MSVSGCHHALCPPGCWPDQWLGPCDGREVTPPATKTPATLRPEHRSLQSRVRARVSDSDSLTAAKQQITQRGIQGGGETGFSTIQFFSFWKWILNWIPKYLIWKIFKYKYWIVGSGPWVSCANPICEATDYPEAPTKLREGACGYERQGFSELGWESLALTALDSNGHYVRLEWVGKFLILVHCEMCWIHLRNI